MLMKTTGTKSTIFSCIPKKRAKFKKSLGTNKKSNQSIVSTGIFDSNSMDSVKYPYIEDIAYQ